MVNILLSVVIGLLIINLILYFYLSVFIVRMSDRFNSLFSELIQVIASTESTSVVPPVTANKPKTWDEKYEMELEMISRRMRQDSGLSDIPTVRSYDLPSGN